MAKVKAVNYSAEQIAVLTSEYKGVDNAAEVAALATKLNKSPASVRAKLASLKLYKAEKPVSEKSEKVTKEVIASAIAEKVGLKEHEVEGLAKATKSALEKIMAALVRD